MKSALLLLLLAAAGIAQVSLSGNWKMHAGDDPRWASPNFDDSQWSEVALPSILFQSPAAFWLRHTAPGPDCGNDCWLTLGLFAGSYEVYVNGRNVWRTEDFDTPDENYRQPRAFRIPGAFQPDRPVTIALRARHRQLFWGRTGQGIVDAGPYWITSRAHALDAVEAATRGMRLAISPSIALVWVVTGIGSCLLIVWFSERDRLELLFFGLYLLVVAADDWVGIRVVFGAGSSLVVQYLYRPLNLAGLLLLCVAVNRILGLPTFRARFVILLAVSSLAAEMVLPQTIVFLCPFLGVLIWQCTLGVRSSWRLNWPVVVAGALFIGIELNTIVRPWVRILPLAFSAAGLSLSYTSVAQSILGAVLLVLVLRRLSQDRREKLRMSAELEAARGIQQLLLAGHAQPSKTYSLEAVYLPAQELGGDLYYSLPTDDGGFTLVTGDVSGKGLKAALQVSLVVGAMRESQERRHPGCLLQALNRAVYGQTAGGFVTCCCAHFAPDGTVVIANAGHVAPFAAGRELPVEPGLPLGVAEEADYTESTIRLLPREAMTFLSDGVIEAVNAHGELMGFERTAVLSTKAAAEIAEAARAWGQNDDITVVTIRRRQ